MSEISPTSVILFDAAAAYANGTADTSIRSDLRIAFVAGAEWQWKRVGDDLAAKDAEIERIQDLVSGSEQERYRAAGVLVAKDAEIERLREALESIRLYANDTLSGRVDGPDDRQWQREAVIECRNRARMALNPEASNV